MDMITSSEVRRNANNEQQFPQSDIVMENQNKNCSRIFPKTEAHNADIINNWKQFSTNNCSAVNGKRTEGLAIHESSQ